MAVARVAGMSATSPQCFEDAIRPGLERATTPLRDVTSAWVRDQRIKLENGKITECQFSYEVASFLES